MTVESVRSAPVAAEVAAEAAAQAAADLAADDVVYAEVRFAPELHVVSGLPREAVVDAVQSGFRSGEATAKGDGDRRRTDDGRSCFIPHLRVLVSNARRCDFLKFPDARDEVYRIRTVSQGREMAFDRRSRT